MNDAKNLLDFAPPGPLDETLLNVPGFVNEVEDWTLQHARGLLRHVQRAHAREDRQAHAHQRQQPLLQSEVRQLS